jgi:hypothetical protein
LSSLFVSVPTIVLLATVIATSVGVIHEILFVKFIAVLGVVFCLLFVLVGSYFPGKYRSRYIQITLNLIAMVVPVAGIVGSVIITDGDTQLYRMGIVCSVFVNSCNVFMNKASDNDPLEAMDYIDKNSNKTL